MLAKLFIVFSCLSVALLGGCSGGSQAPKCVPGFTVECPCPGGQPGAQTCTSAGTFAACVCLAPAVDAGGFGGAGGTATALSGTGGQVSLDGGPVGAGGATIPPTSGGGAGGMGGATIPPTSGGGAGGMGGATIPPTSGGGAGGQASLPADASVGAADGPVVVVDSGLPADVNAVDVVYSPTTCGDGVVALPELCDDGNTAAGDGCSPTCRVEIGYKCSGSPSVCTPTTCGDGVVEGAESCDDGNNMPFDGCSADCQNEPNCNGDSCTSRCGDGIVLAEACDDGNNIDGDGCSKDCKIEPGFTCSQPPLGDKVAVPVIYRDFRFHNPTDFESGGMGLGLATATKGMVETTLDGDRKPVYTGIGGYATVASKDSFAQWYRNVDGVNHATGSKLTLWSNGKGGYVNRYGPNGEQWLTTVTAYYCGNVGSEVNGQPCTYLYGQTDCDKNVALGYKMLKCWVNLGSYEATFVTGEVDGNPLFFPVDSDLFTPPSERSYATIPPYYDASGTFPYDLDGSGNKRLHNFSFTSEVRYWFLYDKSKTYTLDFVGDDDVWVFVNKKLAVDLGGLHLPVSGTVTIDATTASSFGLVDGKVYEVAVFQAERQTTGSSYKLTLTGFNAAPSECSPI